MPSSWTWTNRRSRTKTRLYAALKSCGKLSAATGRELARASSAHFAVKRHKGGRSGRRNSGERVDDERDSAGESAASGQKIRDNYFLVQVAITDTPARGLAAAFLRRAAGSAAGFSAAFGGNYRHAAAIQVRSRHSGSRRSRDRSLDGTSEPERSGDGGAHGRAETESGRDSARGGGTGRVERALGEACRRRERFASEFQSHENGDNTPNKIITNCWECRARRR